jgi:hypothetical protein
MTPDYYTAYRACPRCDKVYQAGIKTQTDTPCPACEAELKTSERAPRSRMINESSTKWFYLQHDPSGDFPPAARFSAFDFVSTLFHGCWPIGAVFVSGNETYTVVEPNAVSLNDRIYQAKTMLKLTLKKAEPCPSKP